MWTSVIKIPESSVVTQDAEGYPTTVTQYRSIPASIQSAQRGDQILAEQKGYSADVVAVVMGRNLHGLPRNWSQFIDVETGDVYELKRVYHQDRNRTVELTGQLVRRGVTA